MKKSAIILVFLVAAYFVFRGSVANYVGVAQPSKSTPRAADTSAARVYPLEARESPRLEPRTRSSRLTVEEIKKRHRLDDIQRMDMDAALGRVAQHWRELKGEHAQVLSYDGKTMTMFIPALHLEDKQIQALMLTHLAIGVGTEMAQSLWEDSVTRDSMLSHAGIGDISTDTTYAFTKIGEENLEVKYPPQLATFVVEVRHGTSVDGRLPEHSYGENLTVNGFTYPDADKGSMIGWNAMAKVPSGYFRSEPILGVASRPFHGLGPVIEDLVTGETEVRDLRFSGSKDIVLVNGSSKPLN